MLFVALGTATTGFEGQWRFLADLQGLGTVADRYPSTDLLPLINDTYRELRELVTVEGYTAFVTPGATTPLPTTAVEAGEAYAVINIGTAGATPPTTSHIKFLDVKSPSAKWRRLRELPHGQLRDFAEDGTPGYPQGWCLLNMGGVSAANYTVGQIAITPVPSGGSYKLWTMNEYVDASATTDVFLYQTIEWKKWHQYKLMEQICGGKDKDTARKLAHIQRMLDPDVEDTPACNIRKHAPTASGPQTWTRDDNYHASRGRLWGS